LALRLAPTRERSAPFGTLPLPHFPASGIAARGKKAGTKTALAVLLVFPEDARKIDDALR
jgi:hypothetical protein